MKHKAQYIPGHPWLAIAIAAAVGATACGGGSSSSGSSDGGSGGGAGVEPVQPAELYEGDYQGPDAPVEMTEAEDGALAMDYAYLGYLLEHALNPHEKGEDPDCGGSATKTETREPHQPQAGDKVTLTTTWKTDPGDGFCADLRRDAPVVYYGEVEVVAEGVWGESTLEDVVSTTTYDDFQIALPIEDSEGKFLELVITGTDQRWSEGAAELETDSWTSIALDVEIPDLSNEEIRFFWFGDYRGDLDEHEIETTFASDQLGGSVSTRQTAPDEVFDGVCEDGPMNWSTEFDGADAASGTVNISAANAELVGDLNAITGCGDYALSENEGPGGISGNFTLLDQLIDNSSDLSFNEDCTNVDPTNLTIEEISGDRWRVNSGNIPLVIFDEESKAETAVEIIEHYGFTSYCYVDRPDPPMTYWRTNGEAPSTSSAPAVAEDCISIDPENLTIEEISGDRWRVNSGNIGLVTFDEESNAETAVEIIEHYGFTSYCFVDRPDPPMTYWTR